MLLELEEDDSLVRLLCDLELVLLLCVSMMSLATDLSTAKPRLSLESSFFSCTSCSIVLNFMCPIKKFTPDDCRFTGFILGALNLPWSELLWGEPPPN